MKTGEPIALALKMGTSGPLFPPSPIHCCSSRSDESKNRAILRATLRAAADCHLDGSIEGYNELLALLLIQPVFRFMCQERSSLLLCPYNSAQVSKAAKSLPTATHDI